MLEETAKVLAVTGGRARVALIRTAACGDCGAKSMCHPTSETSMEMEVNNPADAQPGQKVIVSLPAEALLKASAAAYLLPASLMVAGSAIGWYLLGTDMGAVIGAVSGFVGASMLLLKFSAGRKSKSMPSITKVLG
ncbi:MAG: SoxR reducing system RseC family protein [Deltaproteobacteria bacterium]|nr:SoxR reducing system RseC family protein [Deltaproteobacteria bacterium]